LKTLCGGGIGNAESNKKKREKKRAGWKKGDKILCQEHLKKGDVNKNEAKSHLLMPVTQGKGKTTKKKGFPRNITEVKNFRKSRLGRKKSEGEEGEFEEKTSTMGYGEKSPAVLTADWKKEGNQSGFLGKTKRGGGRTPTKKKTKTQKKPHPKPPHPKKNQKPGGPQWGTNIYCGPV